MTGITDAVIGMDPKICLNRVRKQVLYRMELAPKAPETETAVQGIIAEIDGDTGRAFSIRRI